MEPEKDKRRDLKTRIEEVEEQLDQIEKTVKEIIEKRKRVKAEEE